MTESAPTPRRRTAAWIVAFVVASLTGMGLLLGIGCAMNANACPFGTDTTAAATDGATVFAQNCSICHGVGGEGARGPSLVTGPLAKLSFTELVAKIERGRPFKDMPRYEGKLSEAQIAEVARYVLDLRVEDATTPSPKESP